jgi:hypothetical protein
VKRKKEIQSSAVPKTARSVNIGKGFGKATKDFQISLFPKELLLG